MREVAFKLNRKGRKMAYIADRCWPRWHRLSVNEAEQMIATGTAIEVEYRPFTYEARMTA